ncbi:MAG TPA: hypothetical protein DCM40_39760 [Maribacter sp.]|nr:hypothetical protein [Maribacter sp.]
MENSMDKTKNLKKLIEILEKEKPVNLKTLLLQNIDLLNIIFDFQEFMEENGKTEEFTNWVELKNERVYH